MVKQHPIIVILSYAILFISLSILFIGVGFSFFDKSINTFSTLIGGVIVFFVASAKTFLCLLLIFSFYYYEKKHKNLLIVLCLFVLLLPVTLYTANNFNLYNSFDWFINNPFIILILTALSSLFVLINQVFFTLNKNLIKVSILDGIKTKDFFIKIYLPTIKINIVTILLIQFIYGYVKF